MACLAGAALGLLITLQSLIVVYALIYLLYVRRSFQMLNELEYKQFRMANFLVRLQASRPLTLPGWG